MWFFKPALHCVDECTGGLTFKDHFDLVGHRANGVGGVAVVETRLGHPERVIRFAQLPVGAPEPRHIRRGVSVNFTHQILWVTVEHWDRPWKFGDVNDGLIC